MNEWRQLLMNLVRHRSFLLSILLSLGKQAFIAYIGLIN